MDMDNSSWQPQNPQNDNIIKNKDIEPDITGTANVSDIGIALNSSEQEVTEKDEARYIQEIKDSMPKTDPTKKSTNSLKIILAISATAFVVIAGVIIFVSLSNKKIVCQSPKGNITLSYRDDQIVDVKTKDINFDLANQNKLFKNLGKAKYIEEFKGWFKAETGISCND